MPILRSLNEKVASDRCESSDRVRKPCAMVPPKGDALARAGSTWIHWKSSIARAKVSMRSCVISTHGETPTSCPTRASSSRMGLTTGRSFSRRGRAELRGEALAQPVEQAARLGAPPRGACRVEPGELGSHGLVRLHVLPQAFGSAV